MKDIYEAELEIGGIVVYFSKLAATLTVGVVRTIADTFIIVNGFAKDGDWREEILNPETDCMTIDPYQLPPTVKKAVLEQMKIHKAPAKPGDKTKTITVEDNVDHDPEWDSKH
jgi:hypothetical protein